MKHRYLSLFGYIGFLLTVVFAASHGFAATTRHYEVQETKVTIQHPHNKLVFS